MNKFTVGVILGSFAGILCSMLKDQDNVRLGDKFKDKLTILANDSQEFANSLEKTKLASQNLQEKLPIAQRAACGIEKDIKNFQENTQHITNEIEYDSKKINHKIQDFIKKD